MFYFGSNTKRDLSLNEHQEITLAALRVATSYPEVQFFLLPSILYFQSLKVETAGTNLWVGNQNVSSTASENITGEVPATALKAMSSDLVMIGHAERRRLFDGKLEISAQLTAAANEGLRVLFCIGETVQMQDLDELSILLSEQLEPLSNISLELLIAYEPVFSIGVNGAPADPIYVDKVLRLIKELLSKQNLAATPLLYGGSVDPENAADYAALEPCDGLFVGRSAWSSNGYTEVFLNGYEAFKNKP
ncbi:MAG: triosephosphate isomerase [Streptomycetaceae bacterium]|nr:MAG: triosephosphate isomerase [Streptomycetaceae bacterium]